MENKRGHMGKTVIFESKDDHDLFLKDYNSKFNKKDILLDVSPMNFNKLKINFLTGCLKSRNLKI